MVEATDRIFVKGELDRSDASGDDERSSSWERIRQVRRQRAEENQVD